MCWCLIREGWLDVDETLCWYPIFGPGMLRARQFFFLVLCSKLMRLLQHHQRHFLLDILLCIILVVAGRCGPVSSAAADATTYRAAVVEFSGEMAHPT
jgi:hypothetical protein